MLEVLPLPMFSFSQKHSLEKHGNLKKVESKCNWWIDHCYMNHFIPSFLYKCYFCALQIGASWVQLLCKSKVNLWFTRSIDSFIGYKAWQVRFMVSSKDFNQPQKHTVSFLLKTYLQSVYCCLVRLQFLSSYFTYLSHFTQLSEG